MIKTSRGYKYTLEEYIQKINTMLGYEAWEADESSIYTFASDPLVLKCSLCGQLTERSRANAFRLRGCRCGIRERIRQHNLQKHGVEHYFQSEDYKIKSTQTCMSRYGVSNATEAAALNQSKNKRQQTLLKNYGVPHQSLVPEITEQIRMSNIKTKTSLTDEQLLFHHPNTLKQGILNLTERLNRKPTIQEIIDSSGYKNEFGLYRIGLTQYIDLYTTSGLSSKGENLIKTILSKHSYTYKSQITFSDLKSPGGGRLKFDVGVFDISDRLCLLIEYDGEQHFNFISFFHETEEVFQYKQLLDQIKNEYCVTHNIPLLRIPYWLEEKDIEEQILLVTKENVQNNYTNKGGDVHGRQSKRSVQCQL